MRELSGCHVVAEGMEEMIDRFIKLGDGNNGELMSGIFWQARYFFTIFFRNKQFCDSCPGGGEKFLPNSANG